MNKDSLLQDALITINDLNARLEVLASDVKANNREIAIIGMACQFPGAANLPLFWERLLDQFDGVGHYPRSRLTLLGLDERELDVDIEKIYGGYLDDIDLFDPDLFNISPREARCMDPQQRLLLLNVHQALTDAGIRQHANFKNTGVFISQYPSQYLAMGRQYNPENSLFMATGNAGSISANRISYHYDLEGPSFVVDSACSSSLASLDIACRYLNEGRIDYALVGAVSLNLNMEATKLLQHANMLSGDGKCKTFDERADGYVPGEGVGVIVLRRLADDRYSGGKIYSVIKSCSINQDGRSNGLTAPNGLAQEAVIQRACADANIRPEMLGYIETHGTGTYLGDPVEIEALGNVVGKHRNRQTPCILGCLKTNIGHLEPAAGIASIIKASLCIHHGKVPGNNHLNRVNPLLKMDNYAFLLPEQPVEWTEEVRTAGVSSFGFGGLNGFTLLASAPAGMADVHALKDYPLYDFNLGSYWVDRSAAPQSPSDKPVAKDRQAFLAYQRIGSPTDLFRAAFTIDRWQLTGIEDTGNFHIGFYIEALYKVFSDHFNARAIFIDHLAFLQPLQISQQVSTEIQIIVRSSDSRLYQADIYFRYATAKAGWGLAAQAAVDPKIDVVPPSFVNKNQGKSVLARISNEEFYRRYEAMGMPGRGFARAIEDSCLYSSEAYSTLSPSFDPAAYRLGAHPGFLDAVIQPAFMMLEASAGAPYMTTALKGITIYGPLSRDKTYGLHNRLLSVGDAEASHFSTSWTVYDSDNHVSIDCQSARLQKIAHKAEPHTPSENLLQETGPEALLQFIADRLDTSPEKVRTNVPLPELGMDSLMMMRIRAMMDKINKPVHDLFNVTVDDLLGMIGEAGHEQDRRNDGNRDFQQYHQHVRQVRRTLKPYSRDRDKWIRGKAGGSTGLRLFCFPYGHLSSPVVFKNWVGQFPDHIQVVPVEMPGHGDRIDERPIESAAEIAETLTSILGGELHHPFALFGHSSGALIAYAWALHLQKSKQPLPEKLIVSAFTAPTITPNPVIRMAVQDYEKGGIHHIPTLSEILDPANDALVGKIIALHHQRTREMGLIDLPPDFIAAQLHAIVAIMRTVSTFDSAAIVPLSIPIVACHGENDLQVSYGDMQAWQTLTTGSFSMPVFPGDHLFIHPDQSEALVISAIREMLHG